MKMGKFLLCVSLTVLASPGTAQTDNVQLQIANLQSPDPAVRANAASTLGRFKDARAFDPLVASLNDQDASVRMAAALSLSNFKEPSEVPPLIALLKDPDEGVSQAAVLSLGVLRDPRAIPALISALSNHRGARMGLRNIGQAAVPALIEALRNDNPNVRAGAAEVLGEIRDPVALPPLLAAVYDSQPEVRISVAVALSEFPNPKAAEAVLSSMRDDNPHVREVVARLVNRLKDPRGVEALIVATRDPNQSVQLSAWHALGASGDQRAVEPLRGALKSGNAAIRMIAINSLVSVRDPEAITDLISEYRNDTDQSTRVRALAVLGSQSDPRVTDLMIAALEDADGGIRLTAATSLVKTKDARAVKLLASAIANPENGNKQPFYQALSSIGPTAFEPLLALVHDSRTCPQAAGYLAATHDPRAVPELLALLNVLYSGPDYATIKLVPGPADLERAAARAHEVTGTCFYPAALALDKLGDQRAIPPLIKSLKTPRSGRSRAPSLLAGFGTPVIEPMIALFHDPDPETRRLAASAIFSMRDSSVAKALNTALTERNIPVLAGAYRYYVALGQSGSEGALVEALKEYGDSGDEQMASYFLNCGNVQLENAARAWGQEHHFNLRQTMYGVIWGHRQP